MPIDFLCSLNTSWIYYFAFVIVYCIGLEAQALSWYHLFCTQSESCDEIHWQHEANSSYFQKQKPSVIRKATAKTGHTASRCFETVIPQPTKILGQICLQHNVALKILNRMMLSNFQNNEYTLLNFQFFGNFFFNSKLKFVMFYTLFNEVHFFKVHFWQIT